MCPRLNEGNERVMVRFLHPHETLPSFHCPDFEDVLSVHRRDAISKVDLRVNYPERVYNLSKQVDNSNRKLYLERRVHSAILL